MDEKGVLDKDLLTFFGNLKIRGTWWMGATLLKKRNNQDELALISLFN